MKLENLPTHLLIRILKYFQTCILINNCTDKELLKSKRKKIFVETDTKTLINLSKTNKFFNNLINRSDHGLLIWTIYYDSIRIVPKNLKYYVHCHHCKDDKCLNICHYITKDINYTDIHKKINKHHLSRQKKKKNNESIINEQETKFSESSQFLSISIDSNSDSESDCIL